MTVNSACRDGDIVLIRTRVEGTYLQYIRVGHTKISILDVDVVKIETPNFQVGDAVVAQGFCGKILALTNHEVWFQPDNGRPPSTILLTCLDRAPQTETDPNACSGAAA